MLRRIVSRGVAVLLAAMVFSASVLPVLSTTVTVGSIHLVKPKDGVGDSPEMP